MSILFFFLVSISNSSLIQNPDNQPTQLNLGSEEVYEVDVDWGFLNEEETKHLNEKLTHQVAKAKEKLNEDPGYIRDVVIDNAPPVIFCLVPLFAVFLKLTYFNLGRYYTEHFVLALHNHSFLFAALLCENLIGLLTPASVANILESAIDIWIPIYLLLSLKVTYKEGWFVTFCKYVFLVVCYFTVFTAVGISAAIIGVMSL